MSVADPVRIAVAGLGGIGIMHARNVMRQDGAELVAVASGTPDRAAEVAAALGAGVKPLSHDDVPGTEEIDAVVLCCRAREHVRYALPLLEGGKHVLLEKPGATNLADHDRLRVAAESATDSVLQIAYMRRFDPAFAEARRLVTEGVIGEPLVVRMTSRDEEFPAGEDPADTGGFLLDMAVHDYDTAAWVLGQRPVRVSAARQALVHRQLLEAGDLDNAFVTVSFDGGGLASSHISRTCAFGHDIRAEVMGREGSIFVGNGAGGPGVTVLDVSSAQRFPRDYQARFEDAFRSEIAHFVAACAAVQEGTSALSAAAETSGGAAATLEDDWNAVATGVAARASAVYERPLAVGEDWPWPSADERAAQASSQAPASP
ncbi:MAG TPA: Gfo/Idh/MocA family oxidoreductase [Solirubrobacteraceae bacterium]|nr:Gfo/Idh/MocA family oxidoreductase [Solirubrobacteraceae bacterium]